MVAFAGRGQRSVDWRLRYAAVGLFARGRPCCYLSLVLCLLARMALLCPHLDRCLGMGNLGKPLLLSRQLPRNGQAIRYIGLISRLGLQLRLDLARVVIRQSTVAAGVGMDLGAIQRHRPQLQYRLSRATPSTRTNCVSICLRKRCRNVAIVSWLGYSLAAMQRQATES